MGIPAGDSQDKHQQRVQQVAAEYVVGYCFRHDFGAVALIEKIKPAWQKGKLNGIGGKVEAGETPAQAMAREFAEEAGVHADDWLHLRTEQFNGAQEQQRGQPTGARVHHFARRATPHEWDALRSITDEIVVKVAIPLNCHQQVIYNMHYLIPMAAVLLQQPPENRPVP